MWFECGCVGHGSFFAFSLLFFVLLLLLLSSENSKTNVHLLCKKTNYLTLFGSPFDCENFTENLLCFSISFPKSFLLNSELNKIYCL